MTIFEIIIWHLIVKVCGQSPTYQCVFLCTACSIIISNYVKWWFDVQSKQSICKSFVKKIDLKRKWKFFLTPWSTHKLFLSTSYNLDWLSTSTSTWSQNWGKRQNLQSHPSDIWSSSGLLPCIERLRKNLIKVDDLFCC